MNQNSASEPDQSGHVSVNEGSAARAASDDKKVAIKIFGIGNAGISMLQPLIDGGFHGVEFIAVNTDPTSLLGSSATQKIHLETKLLRGMGTGGDPERGQAAAEEAQTKLKEVCQGAGVVFIIAGLGGGAGTGISAVLARVAREAGAVAIGFVTTPFDCEGRRRQNVAQDGLEALREAADAVICLPNQKVFKLIDENTSVVSTFKLIGDLLADGVRGVWRLLAHPGLLDVHFGDFCALMRDRHMESSFASTEAIGATRSREAIDKLLAHPMLDGGQLLAESDAVLVSLIGGTDLTMTEVNRVMQEIQGRCDGAHVMMGAAIDEKFCERLAITVIVARKGEAPDANEERVRTKPEELETQLLSRTATTKPKSRLVPPAPELPPDKVERLLSRQRPAGTRGRKATSKMRQGQLPLEIISKGRFDKSEPTIHMGEDLDVPTYIRRGISLN
jgi:cell division protein FtsZ